MRTLARLQGQKALFGLSVFGALVLGTVSGMAGTDTFAECSFDMECFEAETCTQTDFQTTIEHNDEFAFVLQSVAEDVTGLVFDNGMPDRASTLMGQTETAAHLLTIQPDGAARYSVHMQGPMVITYLGNCEVAN